MKKFGDKYLIKKGNLKNNNYIIYKFKNFIYFIFNFNFNHFNHHKFI